MNRNVFKPVNNITKSLVETGGLCKTIYFKWEDVYWWPPMNPVTGTITQELLLKPGKVFYTMQAAEKGRSFKEVEKFDGAGPFMEMEITGQLGGNSLENMLAIQTMMFHRFGMIVEDRYGFNRLIGNKDSGARFVHEFDGADTTSSIMRKVKFSWEHPLPAPVYLSGVGEEDDEEEGEEEEGIIMESGEFIFTEDGEKIFTE